MPNRDQAVALLRTATGSAQADFLPGQWEAIDAIVNDNSRALVVQRTGWGKSMVYFVATRLLRQDGAGLTLIVSPLLALMRNQTLAARSLGLSAHTINTSNSGDWNEVAANVAADLVDLLIISPERLANDDFLQTVLAPVAGRIRLLVVDEAHCISDWGHDFRPDYQRVDRVIRLLPRNVSVLATTATANDRVVEDVGALLGAGARIFRGPLTRDTLSLQATRMPSQTSRLAWLAMHVPHFPGSGIIYTLTTRDAERVTEWLVHNGIKARAYHGKLAAEVRLELEDLLLTNRVKVLVATNSLGMGYDKPDLGFVVHYQAPQSLVHYYQQVGRAGRGIPSAIGVLLSGDEDEDVNGYFIESAFPSEREVMLVITAVEEAEDGLSDGELEQQLNLRRTKITQVTRMLSAQETPPIAKAGGRWQRAPVPFALDHAKIARLTSLRQAEWRQVQAYLNTSECLMTFLATALDDKDARPCGRCSSCLGRPLVTGVVPANRLEDAQLFSRRIDIPIEPRKQWLRDAFPAYGWSGSIPMERRNEGGRALAVWRDAGWGGLISKGKAQGRFSGELVEACALLVSDTWRPNPRPTWVTCIPSLRSKGLMPDFSERLAHELGVPFVAAIVKVAETERQRHMVGGWHQAHNLDGAFRVEPSLVIDGPVLLVDDVVDSRWSFTVAGALLREAGAGEVFPLALALASPSAD